MIWTHQASVGEGEMDGCRLRLSIIYLSRRESGRYTTAHRTSRVQAKRLASVGAQQLTVVLTLPSMRTLVGLRNSTLDPTPSSSSRILIAPPVSKAVLFSMLAHPLNLDVEEHKGRTILPCSGQEARQGATTQHRRRKYPAEGPEEGIRQLATGILVKSIFNPGDFRIHRIHSVHPSLYGHGPTPGRSRFPLARCLTSRGQKICKGKFA